MELIASSNTTARLAHGGLSDCAEAQAINILREQLLSGVLEPGARLTEIELSSELQIARATVRQALHHLAQQGLIVLIPYTGWMVIDLTSGDAWEIYTLRAAIEALAAKLAATNLSDLGRQELQDIMAHLAKAAGSGLLPDAAKADFASHKAIAIGGSPSNTALSVSRSGYSSRRATRSSPERRSTISTSRLSMRSSPATARAALLSEQHNISEGEKLITHLKMRETNRPK